MWNSVLKRFAKGFLAGGIAQVLLVINGGLAFHNLAEAQNIAFVLLAAFLTGGLLAVQKLISWQDTPSA